ncbi:MAG TPA: PAS domain-containing protein [Leptospiraceae bacterium]|nr:PAS domain-containing protein [Leptospiraceae bacterium]
MNETEIKDLIPSWIVNSKNHYLIVTDMEGKYRFVNNLFQSRFSFLAEDFIGLSTESAVHPEDFVKCTQAVMQCFANPQEIIELEIRKPANRNGDYFASKWEFSLFTDKNNQPLGILCLGQDITEVQRQSKIAKDFSQKMDTIIENITDGFYVLDRDWNFLTMNSVAEDVLGIKFKTVEGQSIWKFFPDSPNYNYPAQYRKAMNEQVTVHFEEYRSDLQRWFSCVAYPSIEGLMVLFRDNTQEKKIKQAIIDSEKKLRALLDSTTDNNIMISPDYDILCFNKSANEMSLKAYGKGLIENSCILDYIMERDQADFKREFLKAFGGEIVNLEKEIHFEGFSIWTEASFYPVYDENQRVIAVTYNTTLIEARKRAEEKLSQSEVMLNSIYNSSNDSHTFLSKDFKILYLNKETILASKQLFGRSAQKGDKALDFVLPELREEFLQYYMRVLKGESINVEKVHDGQWWLFFLFPVYNGLGELVGISNNVKNITESKKDQFQIISQNAKLREIAWLQSHKVRLHTANILGLCNLFIEHKELSEADKEKSINYILQSAQNLDKVIHEIVKHTDETDYYI